MTAHVASEIERQLRENNSIDVHSDPFVRGVYHGRLDQFRNSIYGIANEDDEVAYSAHEVEFLAELIADTDEHLKASLSHISKAHRKQVVVFLDNVDQRDAEFQNQVFVIAQTMAESWPVTVFLALRPETFYESRREGSLAAYQPRAFTIAPPRVEVVLKKRLSYALEMLRDGGLRTQTGVEISVDLTTLTNFMEAVHNSLQRRPELLEFLENVSNGNIREALGFLEMYIGSPHVNLSKMVRVLDESGRYTVPIQDLVKSVLFGDGEYYDPDRSAIGNVFAIDSVSRADHFLIPLLVEFLQERSAESTGADGFVELPDIYRFFQEIGFNVDSVTYAINQSVTSRLITRAGFDRRGRTEARAYRVAPCGLYVVRKLMRSFTYLDAVLDDTPIVDSDFFTSLSPISHSRELDARLRRAERFIKYLDDSWQTFARADLILPFSWPAAAGDAVEDVRRIRERTHR